MSATRPIAQNAVNTRRHLPTIDSLQWLRCLAATLVVLYHTEVQLFRLADGHVNNMGFGASGVDLFFVITGFIMVYVTHERVPTFGMFMFRRLLRIAPLYWLFTAMMLVLVTATPSLLHSAKFELPHVLSSFLFLPFPHPVLDDWRPLLVPGWTLNYEMFFYVLYGAFLFLTLPLRIAAVSAVFIALVAAHLAGMQSPVVYFYGAPIVLEFIGGMLIAYLYFARDEIPLAAIAGAVLAGAVMSGAAIWAGVSEQPERAAYWGVAATAFVLAAVFTEKAHGWPKVPLLSHLGDASYSIYLSHLFVISAITVAIDKTGAFALLGTMGTRAIMIVSALAAGSAVHRLIEKPLGELLAVALTRKRAPSLAK